MKKSIILILALMMLLSSCGRQPETPLVPEEPSAEESVAEANPTPTPIAAPAPRPDVPMILSTGPITYYGNLVTIGSRGYELFMYNDAGATTYANLVATAASALSSTAKVYAIVPPSSGGIMFPDDLRETVDNSDADLATSNVFSKMGSVVQQVNCYPNLMKHRDEYLYFRTDYHWTARAAYYAYESFCQTKGIQPTPIDSYESVVFDNFLGSFYIDTGNSELLGKTPDYVEAYYPNCSDYTMTYLNAEGVQINCPVIYDATDTPSSLKYGAFIAGDNPFTEITNNVLMDNSACVVVKESYGNAFVPFLVEHYQKVYVIDYRYWTGNLMDFAKEQHAQDVIFLNCITTTSNELLLNKLTGIIE